MPTSVYFSTSVPIVYPYTIAKPDCKKLRITRYRPDGSSYSLVTARKISKMSGPISDERWIKLLETGKLLSHLPVSYMMVVCGVCAVSRCTLPLAPTARPPILGPRRADPPGSLGWYGGGASVVKWSARGAPAHPSHLLSVRPPLLGGAHRASVNHPPLT